MSSLESPRQGVSGTSPTLVASVEDETLGELKVTAIPFLNVELPIVAAPMAGGPTTVELARAVAGAGGFPFLAGGYKTPESLAAEVAQLREYAPSFGVNLFVPAPGNIDTVAFGAYCAELQPEADIYGLRLDSEPVGDDDHWEEKLSFLLNNPVPVVSLTFALPDPADIAALRRAGSHVLASVTTAAEATAAHSAGVDGVIVQSPAAGGHSATYDPARQLVPISTQKLVRDVRCTVDLPLIAAGGIDSPGAVRALRDTGADAVAVGTLLLRTDEAGTSPTHRAALIHPGYTETAITRAFTGRPARALRNGFIDRHDQTAPTAYPAVHHLTRALRQMAGQAGDADRLHLWAGTGYRNAPAGPAATVIRKLAEHL